MGAIQTLKIFHGGLFLCWALVFFPLYPELIQTWLDDSNNSHGILVPLIAAYLVWQKWPGLKDTPVQVDWRGAVVLFASLMIYILSFAGGVAVSGRSMMVFSLMGLVLLNYGSAVSKQLAFPLFFLLFMVPVPVSIIRIFSLPLQHLATDISAALIRLSSIPVYQEGNMLYFVQTQLEVAEACSGIQSMIAMLMLGTLLVYMQRMRKTSAIVLIAASIPIAMIANITRVTGTGILAHFYGSRVAQGFLHDFSGMAVFAFGLALLLAVAWMTQRFLKN